MHFNGFQLLTRKPKIFIWNIEKKKKHQGLNRPTSKRRRWTCSCICRTCDTRWNDTFSVQRSAVISLSGAVCQCRTSSEPAQIVGEKRLWHLWRVSICITSVVGPVPLIHKTSRKDKAASLCASVRSRSSCKRVKKEKLPCRWAVGQNPALALITCLD